MQIRIIILVSFVLLLSVVALPLMAVLFYSSRDTVEEEIGRNLTSDAIMLMEEVDLLMYEGMQNVHSWSRLDIIQEVRIQDIDKRLSQFLNDVNSGYKGVYSNLFYADAEQKVIAASSPKIIGLLHYRAGTEFKAELPNGEVFVEDLQPLAPPYEFTNLVIRVPVYDRYSSENIGHFYGLFELQQLFNLLDKASESRSGDRYVVLLDGEGKVIAASSSLRKSEYFLSTIFADWKPDKGSNLFLHSGYPVTDSSVLVGYASSAGYGGFGKLGWSILIFQSTAKAFLPMRALKIMFVIVIITTIFLAFLLSHLISGHIANPLTVLTKWVKKVRDMEQLTRPEVGGAAEISELEVAFYEMFKELESSREYVIQTAKLAVVGEMSAIMAHEIRTPLGIISTSAQWLQRERNLTEEGKEMSQFILDESARLRKLVTTLLECARPRAPHMLLQNIHDLILHTLAILGMQAEKKHIHVEQNLEATNPVISCDGELLTQAFLNLLLNAIQIVPEGGLIRVSSISLANEIRIEIADNGPGIAVDDYQHLFEPFFSKREGGIGLGLTVTRQIVLAHHGILSAKPSEWGGACFILQLPCRQE